MKSLEELQAIRDRMKAKINNRALAEGEDIRIISAFGDVETVAKRIASAVDEIIDC